MAFWDYLTYIKLGGKWLARISKCISDTQAQKDRLSFWDYLHCIGVSTEAIDDKGSQKSAKRKAKQVKINNKI